MSLMKNFFRNLFLRFFPKKRTIRKGYIDTSGSSPKKPKDLLQNKLVLLLLGGGALVLFLAVTMLRSQTMGKLSSSQDETIRALRETIETLADVSRKVTALEQRTDMYVSREELSVTIESIVSEVAKGMSSNNSHVESNLEKRIDALESSVRLTAEVLQEELALRMAEMEKRQSQILAEDPPETLEEIAGVNFEDPELFKLSPATPVKFSANFQRETEKEIQLTKLVQLYAALGQVPIPTDGQGNPQSKAALALQDQMLAMALGREDPIGARRTLDPNSHGIRERSSVLEGGIDEREGWTIGTRFPGILETGLASLEGGCIAKVRITEPILYKGYTIIPKNSFFVGYAEPDWSSRRLHVTLTRLVIENVEFPINATLEDPRGRPGIASKVIEPEALAASKSVLPMWAAAILRASAQVAITEVSAGAGLLGFIQETQSHGDTAMLAASDWFAQQADLQQKMASKRPPVILANPGENVHVVLLEKLPISVFGDSSTPGL